MDTSGMTTDRIMELVTEMGHLKMHTALWEHVDSCYDAICEYSIDEDKLEFDRRASDNTCSPEHAEHFVHVTEMSAFQNGIDSSFDWRTDLFDEEEVDEIDKDYAGDWKEWLAAHPDYTMEERCQNASEEYYEENWYGTLDSIRDSITAALGGAE